MPVAAPVIKKTIGWKFSVYGVTFSFQSAPNSKIKTALNSILLVTLSLSPHRDAYTTCGETPPTAHLPMLRSSITSQLAMSAAAQAGNPEFSENLRSPLFSFVDSRKIYTWSPI